MKYDIKLTHNQILKEGYKQLLGGKREHWEMRGKAQLDFLRSQGLREDDVLADIGCGPIRAGEYFIRFLEAGNYIGIDYNGSFIEAARKLVVDKGLEAKEPLLRHIQDFALPDRAADAGYAIAFSVLNHCNDAQRQSFFRNVGDGLAAGAKVFVTHAGWLDGFIAPRSRLHLVRLIDGTDVGFFDEAWSSADRQSLFPIAEFVVRDNTGDLTL